MGLTFLLKLYSPSLLNAQLTRRSVLSDFVKYLSVTVPNDVTILSDSCSIVSVAHTVVLNKLSTSVMSFKAPSRRQISVAVIVVLTAC